MVITVTGRHLEITQPIREYAEKRVSKLSKYYNRIQGIAVVADKGDHRHYEVEIRVTADRTEPFITKVHDADLYAGIDQAVDKLERQLTDHKEIVRNHHGKTSMSG